MTNNQCKFSFSLLSIEETKQINGGGAVSRWLGTVTGYIKNTIEATVNGVQTAIEFIAENQGDIMVPNG